MAELESNDQELETLKNWWRSNGTYVIVGLLVGFGGLFGWQTWQDRKQQTAQEAAAEYQQLLEGLQAEDLAPAKKRQQRLRDNYAGTPYATNGALALAARMAEKNNLQGAAEQLELALQTNADAALTALVQVRLARVQLAQGKYEAALGQLDDAAADESFAGTAAELRGDIFVAQQQYALARNAYEKALGEQTGGLVDRRSINIKLDALPAPDMADNTAARQNAPAAAPVATPANDKPAADQSAPATAAPAAAEQPS